MAKKVLSLLLAFTLALSLSVTALAEANVKIHGNLVLTEVIRSELVTYGEGLAIGDGGNGIPSISNHQVRLYTVPVGVKIDISGSPSSGGFVPFLFENKNGTLNYISTGSGMYLEPDMGRIAYSKGEYVQFNYAGIFEYQHYNIEGVTAARVFLNVVNTDSSSSANTNQSSAAPAPSTTPAPSTSAPSIAAPSAPTARTENDVLVAGQYRTPGRIQNFGSGHLYTVNHGDTLYDLTARFYGNGNLWRELQKVNQEYLNQTKDGIIFVGFNLLVPAELGGVRANVR